jgi:hypothetical protein
MGKISDQYRERLRKLGPGELSRALVILSLATPEEPGRRTTADQRRQLLSQRRGDTTALHEIDAVIERHGGRRLSASLSGIGTVVVECTAGSLHALAELDRVKTIVEDQPLLPPRSTLPGGASAAAPPTPGLQSGRPE